VCYDDVELYVFSDPDMPADIKAAATGEDSVLLVWRPPLHANGILTKYTIIMKDLSDREVLAVLFSCCYLLALIHLREKIIATSHIRSNQFTG